MNRWERMILGYCIKKKLITLQQSEEITKIREKFPDKNVLVLLSFLLGWNEKDVRKHMAIACPKMKNIAYLEIYEKKINREDERKALRLSVYRREIQSSPTTTWDNTPDLESSMPDGEGIPVSDSKVTGRSDGKDKESNPESNKNVSKERATQKFPEVKRLGQYTLVEKIGTGGMGVVYKAYHKGLDKYFAVKTILSIDAGDEQIKRFVREAKVSARLSHPNIVAVHDVGEEKGQHYIVMDYIAGTDLGDIISREKLYPRTCLEIVRDIAKALETAHRDGIIHRDIKPSNILIESPENRPYLTDFGLASVVKSDTGITRSGQVLGTPKYMSPEQAMGQMNHMDGRSDIYSLGAVLYEMLSGKPAVEGDNIMNILYQVVYKEPVLLSNHVSVAQDVEAITMKCLEKSPVKRYQSAGELAEDIERYLRGEPIHARSVGIIYKLSKLILRNKIQAASLLLITGILSVLIYIFFFAAAKLTVITKARIGGKAEEVHAEIEVDGSRIETDTLKDMAISRGYHRLLFSLKDHLPIDFLIKTSPREEIKLEKEFIHEKGCIDITSSLPQVEASFVNKSSGEATRLVIPVYKYEIDTGDYEITFNKDNYFELKKEITINRYKPVSINVELEPVIIWSLDISEKPDGIAIAVADLDLDGEFELICGTSSGNIVCYNPRKRERLWQVRHDIMHGIPSRLPQIFLRDMNRDGIPDILYSYSHRFMVIDGKTHKETFSLPNWWGEGFITKDANGDGYEDLILMCYYDIQCYDLKNEKMLFSYPKSEGQSPSPTFIDESRMIYGIKGKLYTVDIRSGKTEVVFSYQGEGCPPRVHITNSGNPERAALLWYTNDGGMYCVDRHSFKILWQWPFQSRSGNPDILTYQFEKDKKQVALVHLDALYCLSVETGEVMWSFDTHNTGRGSAPSVADLDGDGNPEIVVTNSEGILFILNAREGKLLGKFTSAEAVQHAVADIDGDGMLEIFIIAGQSVHCIRPLQDFRVKALTKESVKQSVKPVFFDLNGDNKLDLLVTDGLGELCLLDGKDWEKVWSHKFDAPISSHVVVADINGDNEPDIVVDTDDGVVILDRHGREIWCKKADKIQSLKAPVLADIDKDGIPEIIAASYTGTISCLRSKTGEILWQSDAKRIFSIPIVADVDKDGWPEVLSMCGLYYNNNCSYLFCFDGRTGKQRWVGKTRYHEEGGGLLVKDVDRDGYQEVFARQCGGWISCFDGKTGNPRWERCFRGGDFGGPAIFKDFDNDEVPDIVTGDGDGKILCIDPRTGKEKWRQSTSSGFLGRFTPYIETFDINNDGIPDIISNSSEHSFFSCSGNDGGWLGYIDSLGLFPGPFILVDIDQDGLIDIVFLNRTCKIMCIYDMAGYLNRAFYPAFPSISAPFQDPSILRLAFLNRLLINKAYIRLESEIEKYADKLATWEHVINFYRGICALSRKEIEKALQLFKTCENSPSNIFDNRFLMAVIYIYKGEDVEAHSLIKTLLETSAVDFERCYQKYKDLMTDATKVKFTNILSGAVKESRCEEKFVKSYENAIFMNKDEDAEFMLPLCLKYGSDKSTGYKERYKLYVDRVIESSQQYHTVYMGHRIIDILDKAIEVLPESCELLNKRGIQYLITGISVENAISDLKRSLEINPGQPNVLMYLGQIMYVMRQYKEALQKFEASANLDPKDTNIRFAKIITLLAMKEINAARVELERMVQENMVPKDQSIFHIYKILLSIADNKREDAIREFKILQTRFKESLKTWICTNILEMLKE